MATKDKDLNDLFHDTLKDIYYAEKQILRALPKMAKAASSDKLRAAFEKHFNETEGQVERLEEVFELIEKPARGKTCDAIQWILDECKEIMDEYKGCEALDAGMIWVNSENVRHLPTPFGGVKSSGIGRDGGDYSFDFYMETKNIAIALGDHKISKIGA